MALKQDNRLLSLGTPLGDNELALLSFRGHEEMSRLFEYQLEMISDNNAIAPTDIVGKNVTFGVQLPDQSPRFFNGFISSFVAGDEDDKGRRNYSATVRPWLWFLTQTADCRIFQEKNIPDIIEQVFQDSGFSNFDTSEIKADHKEWEYCVQYRENDFEFVSRLMEQEGIFYFFKHDNGIHTLVLADQNSACKALPEKVVDYPRDSGSRAVEDHITRWEHRYEFRSGKLAQTDFNFKTPSTSLMTQTNTVMKVQGIDGFEVYDYPGIYTEKAVGDGDTKLRMEEIEAGHDVVVGESFCKTFTPGGKFKLREHRCQSEEGKSFIVTAVEHEANEPLGYETSQQSGDIYRNFFTCIPEALTFRPERTSTKPVVQGVQTAIVVGPAGEEIYTDEYGRVKVQFHWDREGQRDENSSCWIRVSQVHAGKGFGGIDIPRIDEEVIVSFLEGDPDRPIITGRVYHAENMPPFGLPDGKVISGMKSNTTKGGGGYNEYVMDDTKENELIREHAQFDKDSTIENDLREHVLNNRTRDVTNNEILTVGNNRTRSVGGSETVTVSMTRTHTVGINEAITVGAAQEITVGGMQSITVGALQDITVGASQQISVMGSQENSVGGNRTSDVGKDDSLTVGKKLLVDAGDEITIKTGAASITMKKDGSISIKGKDIDIKGSGKISAKAGKNVVIKGSKILQN